MSSRRSVAPSSFENSSTESKSCKGGNENKASGARKKTKPSGTVVKSRYLQPVEKTSLSKSNSLTNESVVVPARPSSPKPAGGVRPRVATPPRRSTAPPPLPTPAMSSLLEPSLLGRSILQSTFSDGYHTRPEFDLSVIKERTVMMTPAEPDRGSENDQMILEQETFLLAYLTAKIQSNTAKLKAAAEARMLEVMEEEERLRRENQEKQRLHLLMEQERKTRDLLDLQIAVLTPVCEAAQRFSEEYQTLATAVDTTRHELPVKNIHMEGDSRTFLDKAEVCLKETEGALRESSPASQEDHSVSAGCLRDMRTASEDISRQLSGGVSELCELSSLVSCQSVLVQQAVEEDVLGWTRAQDLYRPAGPTAAPAN